MITPTKSTISTLGLLLVAICALFCQQQVVVSGNPVAQNDKPEPLAPGDMIDTVSNYLAGVQCEPDEWLAQGKLPECEATCENPKPVCPRVFYQSLDFWPCFCKEPLVRNKKTNKCVRLDEC